MKVLITGASGRLGRAVAEQLIDRLPAGSLILGSRTPAVLDDLVARGAEARELDLERPETLPAAFAGVDRVLLISTDAFGRRGAQHAAAIDAASAAGVALLVYTSFPPLGEGELISVEHVATERRLKAGALGWCILRNHPYADGEVAEMASAVARGELVSNTGAGATAFVSREDCAAVAAAVLVGEGHAGQTYDVTGPEALTAADRALLYTEVSGTEVALREIDDETLARELSDAGVMPYPVALGMVGGIGGATRAGAFETVSDVVPRLTGRPATSLRDVLAGAAADSAVAP